MTDESLRLSVLDQAPIAEGSTGADALRNSVDLARLADELGYQRYWVAEHHGTPMLACASPEVLIGRDRRGDLAHPGRQRRRHAAALQPAQGRRDVQHAERPVSPAASISGSAARRAPIPLTAFALQRDRRQPRAGRFSRAARGAAGLPRRHDAGGPPFARLAALPGRPERPDAVAARLVAAERRSGPPSSGCPMRSRTSSTRMGAEIAAQYRRDFTPSRWRAGTASGRRGLGALRGDGRRGGAARRERRMAFTLFLQGQLIPVPPVENALAISRIAAGGPCNRGTRPAPAPPDRRIPARCGPASRRWRRSTARTR